MLASGDEGVVLYYNTNLVDFSNGGVVTPRAVQPRRVEIAPGSRQGQLLAILLLSVICCATALAATSPITACDRASELQSLEVPVSDLSASLVGHVITDPEYQDAATIDVVPTESLSELPILDLAPRVAIILQDVFSAVAIETSDSEASEQPMTIEALPKIKVPLSPVAGDASQADSPELADPASGVEDVDTAPSIQRQMYRTDI